MRPFRFGAVFVNEPGGWRWGEAARRVESEGFSTLLVADHVGSPLCGPSLVDAANATTTLRVGSYVYNNDFRHPAMLAKEVATIDVLSGGRFELGMGAGWLKDEYDEMGLVFDQPGVRTARLSEAVKLVRRLLDGEEVSHQGSYYRLEHHKVMPRPIQPRIPLLIGGGGQRMIRLASRYADTVGIIPRSLPGGGIDASDFAPAAMDAKMSWIEDETVKAGRADAGPERSLMMFEFHPSTQAVSDSMWTSREAVLTSPFMFIGDAPAIIDGLHERRERWGLSYFVCFGHDIDRMAPIVRKLANVEG